MNPAKGSISREHQSDLERLQRIVESGIIEHDKHDGDMNPTALSIGITEVLIRDFGHELIGLIHDIMCDRAYEVGYRYGQRYPDYSNKFGDGSR